MYACICALVFQPLSGLGWMNIQLQLWEELFFACNFSLWTIQSVFPWHFSRRRQVFGGLSDRVILHSDTVSVCVCVGGGDCVHICFRFYSCKQGGLSDSVGPV